MNQRLVNVLWPIIGIGMFLVGLSLITTNLASRNQDTNKTTEFSNTPIYVAGAMLIGGLFMFAPERTKELFRFGTQAWDKIRGTKPDNATSPDVLQKVVEENKEVLGAQETGLAVDDWYSRLQPVLYQAAHYSAPTYYLDTDLHVIDWNVAFEVAFADLVGNIRGKHVNWFIAQLANRDEVFHHAIEFTKRVRENGEIPWVDTECNRSRVGQ